MGMVAPEGKVLLFEVVEGEVVVSVLSEFVLRIPAEAIQVMAARR